jgi:DNA-directed RNA polymerase specialized sigma24 family protein
MAKLAIRMDEVHEFCRRVLGLGEDAEDAAREALAGQHHGRVELLAAAARACRDRAGNEPRTGDGEAAAGLAASVAAEVALATSKLPERHREVLALRESLRLSHDQIAGAIGVDVAAVALLLARARLRLREERRQAAAGLTQCPDRDRSLRALARRQDSEPLTGDDDEWLLAHLGGCVECGQAHAAMIEASVCYRAASPHERVHAGTAESREGERAVAAQVE